MKIKLSSIKSKIIFNNAGEEAYQACKPCKIFKIACKFFVSICAVFFIFNLNACKKQDAKALQEENNKIIVGFSQIGAESAWRGCNTKSMQRAAVNANIQMVYANAEQKQENQIKALRSFIAYQVDAIVFVPIVQDGWDNVLKEAKDVGIPVLVIDRKLTCSDSSLFAGFVGTDSYAEGRKAANFLVEKFGTNKSVNIVEMRGTDGSSVSDGRYAGFREIIEKYPNFKIVASENGEFLTSRGREIMSQFLNESKEQNYKIDAIFSHNDSMTLGALEILEQRNIKAGKDIVIVSIDAEQAAIDALKGGKINCCVECNPDFGEEVIRLVKEVLAGNEIPKFTHVNETVFTENDDLENIEPRGY